MNWTSKNNWKVVSDFGRVTGYAHKKHDARLLVTAMGWIAIVEGDRVEGVYNLTEASDLVEKHFAEGKEGG